MFISSSIMRKLYIYVKTTVRNNAALDMIVKARFGSTSKTDISIVSWCILHEYMIIK